MHKSRGLQPTSSAEAATLRLPASDRFKQNSRTDDAHRCLPRHSTNRPPSGTAHGRQPERRCGSKGSATHRKQRVDWRANLAFIAANGSNASNVSSLRQTLNLWRTNMTENPDTRPDSAPSPAHSTSFPAATQLQDQNVVIVGGTSGIGRTLAAGLRQLGAYVIPTSRRLPEVESTCAELEEDGQASTPRQTCDVTDRNSLDSFLDAVVSERGPVHALVNSAGTTSKSASLDVDKSEWDRILEVNLTGTFLACQTFGGHMVERGYGRIVNIGSLASFVGLHEVAAYTASKAGVAGLTRALAVEWAPHGVCVNALAPGVFRTELNRELLDGTERGQEFKTRTPLRRFGDLKELVGATAFLCSPSASFVCGEVLKVDGGFLASGVNQ